MSRFSHIMDYAKSIEVKRDEVKVAIANNLDNFDRNAKILLNLNNTNSSSVPNIPTGYGKIYIYHNKTLSKVSLDFKIKDSLHFEVEADISTKIPIVSIKKNMGEWGEILEACELLTK